MSASSSNPAALLGLLSIAAVVSSACHGPEIAREGDGAGRCPEGSVEIVGDAAVPTFCIDPYEAALVQPDGSTVDPYRPPPKEGRAVNRAGAVPQAHISQREASAACTAAGKRLCSMAEWRAACRGEPSTTWPYGERQRPGACNDRGRDGLASLFGTADGTTHLYGFDKMNDPRLNQLPGTLARTGTFSRCRGEKPVFDMVGNLHEWTSETGGVLRGGFYGDVRRLGEGCEYAAVGHNEDYRDYSIGFRCCADLSDQ